MKVTCQAAALLLVVLAPAAGLAAPPPAAPPLAAPSATREEPPPAAAPQRREPTAGDLATARSALREGLSLREKGDLPGALARLDSAFDLVPTPVTGFELGKTHMMLGHVLQAHELFKKVLRMPPSMEESSRSQVARDESARLAAELEPRIPSLRLKLTLPPGASAVVKVDDEEIPLTGAETLRAVDPGQHEVLAKAGDGPEEKVLVEVAESEIKDVGLAPTWVPPRRPAGGGGRDVIYVRQTNPLAFIGFGLAGVGMVVTAVSAFVFFDALEDAKALCGEHYCPPARSRNTQGSSLVDRAFDSEVTRLGVSGAIAIAAGISTVVFTGVGILGVSRPIKERVTAGPYVRPSIGAGQLSLTGTF